MKATVFWFRRDLRLHDNTGLQKAAAEGLPVLPVFIFDTNILDSLDNRQDRRVDFIHQAVSHLAAEITAGGGSLLVLHGRPVEIFTSLIRQYDIGNVYANHDYEPYARERDEQVAVLLKGKGIAFTTFKDQCIFEKDEVVKADGQPYTVFTPYKNSWLGKLQAQGMPALNDKPVRWLDAGKQQVPTLRSLGFHRTEIRFEANYLPDDAVIHSYHSTRELPAANGTTRMGIHLRFGTVSIRDMVRRSRANPVLLSELIWREFFMMILWHYPQVVTKSFKERYDNIAWRNNQGEFEAWCKGMTGYPLVDAGMRELNATGYMHNRVRMVTASFLCKHLLIDWRWGEAYFGAMLDDYELSSNNGNWQWAAGTGCDAAPYFRIFNPQAQMEKFDPELSYVKKWVPEIGTKKYPLPIVDHAFARARALENYKAALR